MSTIPPLTLALQPNSNSQASDSPRTEVRNLVAKSPIAHLEELGRRSSSPVDQAKTCMQIFNLNTARLATSPTGEHRFMGKCLEKLDDQWEIFQKKYGKQKPCHRSIKDMLETVCDIETTLKKIEENNQVVGSPFDPELMRRELRICSLNALKTSLEESKTFVVLEQQAQSESDSLTAEKK
jgi:hypothetical protein